MVGWLPVGVADGVPVGAPAGVCTGLDGWLGLADGVVDGVFADGISDAGLAGLADDDAAGGGAGLSGPGWRDK